MTMIVVASNWLVQFPINDLLTWGAITYPFRLTVTDLTTRLHGPASARRVVWAVRSPSSCRFGCRRRALHSHPGTPLASQLLDIQVFQRLRTGGWWRAPLVSSTVDQSWTRLVLQPRLHRDRPARMTLALGDLGVKLLAVLALARSAPSGTPRAGGPGPHLTARHWTTSPSIPLEQRRAPLTPTDDGCRASHEARCCGRGSSSRRELYSIHAVTARRSACAGSSSRPGTPLGSCCATYDPIAGPAACLPWL
jgi:hypothetical protein